MDAGPSSSNASQAVRPKDRRSILKDSKFAHESIETKFVKATDLYGKPILIPLISKEFSLKMSAPEYKEPSFCDISIDIMSLQQLHFEMKKYEAFVNFILSQPYFRFWSLIVYNEEVQKSLESYLVFASRPYRTHQACREGELKISMLNTHQNVYKVFVRMFLAKESPSNFMSEAHHRQLLMSTNCFVNASNILNLIQIYGYSYGSESLCRLLQPFVMLNFNSFRLLIVEMIQIVESYHDDSDRPEDLPNFMQTVSNITDVLFTLNKLPLIEPKIFEIYKENNLASKLITFYGKYFSSMQTKMDNMNPMAYSEDAMNACQECSQSQLKLSQSCSLLIVYNMITKSLQKSLFEPVTSEVDKFKPFDAIIQALNQITEQSNFCYDFFTFFSFQVVFSRLLADKALNTELSTHEILNHYKHVVKTNAAEVEKLRKQAESKYAFPKLDLGYSQTPPAFPQDSIQQPGPSVSHTQIQQNDPHPIRFDDEIVSKEKQIADLFPTLGDGYIYKCLEHFNFDVELTVDSMLCHKLPPQLESLNENIRKEDLVRAHRNVVDSSKMSFDLTTLDKAFIGKMPKASNLFEKESEEVDDKVRQWMKDKTLALAETINVQELKEIEMAQALIERGKLNQQELRSNIDYIGVTGLYEDEFDDTYGDEPNVDVTPREDEKEENDNFNPNPKPPDNRWPSHFSSDKRGNAIQHSKNKQYNKREYNNKKFHQQQQQQVVPPPPPPAQASATRTSMNKEDGGKQQQQQPATSSNKPANAQNRNNGKPNQGRRNKPSAR